MKATLALALFLLVVTVFPASPALANVSVSVCNQTCICIYWDGPTSSTVEVRCTGDAGWAPGGATPSSPVPGDGSWGGGTPTSSTAPGMPLSGDLYMAVSQANTAAKNAVRGDQQYSPELKWYYVPNACTKLFYGSTYSQDGYQLLNGYITYRNGEGVRDPNNANRIPCNEGVSAWTTCCNHDKYVLICNSFLNQTGPNRTATLIHEAMHVAGQRETVGGNNGDQTPPNPAQLTEAVKAACGL